MLLGIALSACRKKAAPAADPALTVPVNQTDGLDFTCGALPPTPPAFGWKDSIPNQDQSINAFFYNPLNPNQIVYVVNGDEFGYNKVFFYNILTRQSIRLCDNSEYLPRMNRNGWIVYSTADLNIFKVKINGDSLTQLTGNNMNSDPQWDYQGNTIYAYQAASISNASRLVQMRADGSVITTIPLDLPNTAMAHHSNRMAYLKVSASIIFLYLRDLATSSEVLLLSTDKAGTTFSNLTFDKNDENLYWSSSTGIFKCNIAKPSIDTVMKNCPNATYDKPYASDFGNKITFGCHVKKPIGTTRLLHQYKALELDMNTKQLHEVKVFP